MPQSLANVLVHIVFSTKERRALLQIPDLRDEMHRYLAGISANLECPAIIVGGATDHIHLLVNQSRTITLAEWEKELKRASSLWTKKRAGNGACFNGRRDMARFQSASRKKYAFENISERKKSIIGGFRSRTSSGRF